jgi:hypothetical protein
MITTRRPAPQYSGKIGALPCIALGCKNKVLQSACKCCCSEHLASKSMNYSILQIRPDEFVILGTNFLVKRNRTTSKLFVYGKGDGVLTEEDLPDIRRLNLEIPPDIEIKKGNPKCHACTVGTENANIVKYSCGHVFHSACYNEETCRLCKERGKREGIVEENGVTVPPSGTLSSTEVPSASRSEGKVDPNNHSRRRRVSSQKSYGENTDDCIICAEEFGFLEHPLRCGHRVHRECIVKWGHVLCPICRADLSGDLSEEQKLHIRRTEVQNRREMENSDRQVAIRLASVRIIDDGNSYEDYSESGLFFGS